jgi:hypothetical protein
VKKLTLILLSFFLTHPLTADEKELAKVPEVLASSNSIHSQHSDHSIGFKDSKLIATYTQEINSKDSFQLALGYKQDQFQWKDFHINQNNFRDLILRGGACTFAAPSWGWDADLTLEMNTDHPSLLDYTFWHGMIHGTYFLNETSNLHIGIIGTYGMHYTRLLPVIGFDMPLAEKLYLTMIFPTSANLIWFFDKNWSLDIAWRLFLSCQRFGKDEGKKYKEGFIAYRNSGLEVGINYQILPWGAINLHCGMAMGGQLRLSDRLDHHRHYYDQKAAPYLGCAASVRF